MEAKGPIGDLAAWLSLVRNLGPDEVSMPTKGEASAWFGAILSAPPANAEGGEREKVLAVLNRWFDGTLRIDPKSELVSDLAALSSPVVGDAPPLPQGDSGAGEPVLWDWLAEHEELELSFGYPGDDEDPGEWLIHQRSGNRSDREWTLIANASTPLGAVTQARAALGEA